MLESLIQYLGFSYCCASKMIRSGSSGETEREIIVNEDLCLKCLY